MKKFNSRKGFTLIELLVIIGILAVLAAIAIPSVAGLIDRANKSADQTNANEYTNAMERFVSEYELFRQDIASGTFDKDNMDAAQSRGYNVTGADDMEDIRALESKEGFNGIRIDINSKYAQNHETVKAVIENYTKTSSATYEPKQSDMTYWYNTVTGYTIIAEKNIDTATLHSKLPTEVNYINVTPASVSEWIDLSSEITIPDIALTYFHVKETLAADGTHRVCYHFSNFELLQNEETEIYIINNYFEEPNDSFVLDINNAKKAGRLQYHSNKCNGESYHRTKGYLEDDFDDTDYFRLCYKYVENGVEKYAYSAVFSFSFQDLPLHE